MSHKSQKYLLNFFSLATNSQMPRGRYLCFDLQKSNDISFSQSLALGLNCLVSIGNGYHTNPSFSEENKRSADDLHGYPDGHRSKRRCRDSSPTNVAGTSHSQPGSCEVDPSQWVELLSMGWTLDDTELIARESEISADTERLWLAFKDLVRELTLSQPSQAKVLAKFASFSEEVECFLSDPRSYLENRIFFNMAEPLMSLSQYIEEWEHLRLQRDFRRHRSEALFRWLSSRNESKALIPGVRVREIIMEDIAADIRFWVRQDCPEYNGDNSIKACFINLLHGIENVSLYEKCIAHIESNSNLDESSLIKLMVIVSYFTNSKVARDVSPSVALSCLSGWVRRNPEVVELDFVDKGWILPNYNLVPILSIPKEHKAKELKVEKEARAIIRLIRKCDSLQGADEDGMLELLENRILEWMTLVDNFLDGRPDYRAIRSVVGMLSFIAAAEEYVHPVVTKTLRDFTMKQRARALGQWMFLANEARLLVHGQRLRKNIMSVLCRGIMNRLTRKESEDRGHALNFILRGETSPERARIEAQRVNRRHARGVLRLHDHDLAGVIVSQLFYRHAGLCSVDEKTLDECLGELMARRASSFASVVRSSDIAKRFQSGCIGAAQRATETESLNIYDTIIRETLHAYEKSWAALDVPENTKAVIDHVTAYREKLSEDELFSALTCLICISHRTEDLVVKKDVAGCIALCEERLKRWQERNPP
eukprot:Blabericola_migrator_1__5663@NODE_2879_length_2250_cov_42_477325_g1806_i0_p1_GENE_NODE_2879_length_2250_cov_42_477325_g1806_i0NODE_2879_length_2250_cov_42_477325_g1806_i0_p1_ORF_typecomplete_len710_score75_07Cas_Csn2/PF09711_10/0_34_NODE_2879_length_2250_cov_42_477325_g1806_i012130